MGGTQEGTYRRKKGMAVQGEYRCKACWIIAPGSPAGLRGAHLVKWSANIISLHFLYDHRTIFVSVQHLLIRSCSAGYIPLACMLEPITLQTGDHHSASIKICVGGCRIKPRSCTASQYCWRHHLAAIYTLPSWTIGIDTYAEYKAEI